ncbi:MAG: hypothetical protein HRU05_16155 [Oceanospirillaceae bacterium]|nr:hypothetical protein [Oceanospirillaceae bacterium]
MIRIDSMTQLSNGGSVRTSSESSSSTFADLLAEQVVKVAQTDNSKQSPVSANQFTSLENTLTTNPRDELERLLSMSPFELIRYQILEQMGLTEEALKELPYEERMKIEEQIKEQIERLMGDKASSENTATQIL